MSVAQARGLANDRTRNGATVWDVKQTKNGWVAFDTGRAKTAKASGSGSRVQARADALSMLAGKRSDFVGAPLEVEDFDPRLDQGRYVADRSRFFKGGRWIHVFPDGTTNDPSRALTDGGMRLADAVAYAVSLVEDDLLLAGWRRPQVVAMVRAKLRSMGVR
jgi:hypothetical protein